MDVCVVCQAWSKILYDRNRLMRSTDRKLMNFAILVYNHIGCLIIAAALLHVTQQTVKNLYSETARSY